jgi:hypothetical protein
MKTPDEEPTEEELREAEELARALARGTARSAPDDALGAAALLRHAKDGGALSDEASDRILADALARARPPSPAPRRWRLFGVLGLATAGALAAVFLVRAPKPAAALPAPPRALLEAELDAASGHAQGLEALRSQTEAYRGEVYAALRDRYGR